MFCVTLVTVASLACVQGLSRGLTAAIWDHPYQAAILRLVRGTDEFRYSCSGAIISETFVMTTASCSRGDPANFLVRVGSSYHQAGGDEYYVKNIYKHQNFTPDFDSDIALLNLTEPLLLSCRVTVAKLPDKGQALHDGSVAVLSLWEHNKESKLQSVTVYVESTEECNARYRKYSPGKDLVTDNMFCIFNQNYPYLGYPNESPCSERDQGGPLVVGDTVYGLSSWSYQCGSSIYPSVATKVSAFTEWINTFL